MKEMKKKDPNRKSWLQTFDKKWQKILAVILLGVCICSLTIAVLLGIDLLYPQKETAAQASAGSSAVTTSTAQAEIPTTLPLSSDAGRDYLNSTLFLGDSNTVRFMNYKDTDGMTYTGTDNTIAVVGMGIQAIDTLSCEQLSTGTYTMTQAVPILQPERILITFGTNNLDGTSSPSSFITEYQKQLQELQDAYPSVDLIVNSIPPIAEINSYPKLKVKQIVQYNTAIQQMCEDNHWKYLNSYEVLCDANTGYAYTGYVVSDGIHLSETGLSVLFTYIRTHAYITNDDRPKPLQDIPTIIGPLTTLYQTNPLNNQQFSQDVLQPNQTEETAAPASSTSAAAPETTAAAIPETQAPAGTAGTAATSAPAEQKTTGS